MKNILRFIFKAMLVLADAAICTIYPDEER